MRLKRGTAAGYLCLALALLMFLIALPWVVLGAWQHAREASAPLAALGTGWILRGMHDDAKRRRREPR